MTILEEAEKLLRCGSCQSHGALRSMLPRLVAALKAETVRKQTDPVMPTTQHTETLEMVKELNRVAELIHFHGLNSASQTSLINLLHKSAQRLELLAKEVEVMRKALELIANESRRTMQEVSEIGYSEFNYTTDMAIAVSRALYHAAIAQQQKEKSL